MRAIDSRAAWRHPGEPSGSQTGRFQEQHEHSRHAIPRRRGAGSAGRLRRPEGLGGHLKTGQSWTGQNRPVGRAPQAVRVFYRIATWFCKSAVTGATIRAGRAGCQPPRKASFRGIPGYGVEPRSSILEALGPSVIRTGGVMSRSARPAGECANSAGRRSARARGGAGGPGRRPRRRCRRGACPSPRLGGSR